MFRDERNNYKITIMKDGPYLVSGGVPLSETHIVSAGDNNEYRPARKFPLKDTYALCRCGRSKNAPFCDGSHMREGFDGTETASRASYDRRAEVFEGEGIDLQDDNRCAFARFCHRDGFTAWDLVDKSDDPKCREDAIRAASECPAGRLVARHKDGEVIEPELEPGIEILQDPGRHVSGPLYVKGGIPIVSADGFEYEVRNRATLCRCGKSCNKPFCDAYHVPTKFRDHMDE